MTIRPAILIERIGPYHKARLSALAAYTNTLMVIEVCKVDETYAWEQQTDGQFERITLFERRSEARKLGVLSVRLSNALNKFRPNVVAVPGWSDPAALMTLDWAQRRGIPSILMSDSRAEDTPRHIFTETVKRIIVANASAGFVAGEVHAHYLTCLGMARERISKGYDVVDNAHFATGANMARADANSRERFGLPEHYFLSVSRFVEKKNLAALLEAHSRYATHANDPIDLVVVGDGPLRPELEAKAGTHATIRPFASYNELPFLFGLAEGVVVPSITDQWGLVVNEAMAAECAVLASSRAGASAELIDDGVNGFMVNPDLPSLEAGIRRFAAADRRSLAKAGRKTIAAWDLDRFTDGLLTAAEIAMHQARNVSKVRGLLSSVLIRLIARRDAIT